MRPGQPPSAAGQQPHDQGQVFDFVAGHGLHGKAGSWKAIGGEGAGVVSAVGEGVDDFKPGDAVMGRCSGAFSEYAGVERWFTLLDGAGVELLVKAGDRQEILHRAIRPDFTSTQRLSPLAIFIHQHLAPADMIRA